MPANKNQHFVPQFYLRNFASNANGKTLRLFNIGRGLLVPEATISGQCHRKWFYGRDTSLESALKDLEGDAATLFRRMINEDFVPTSKDAIFASLINFVAIQRGRTQTAKDEVDEHTDKMAKQFLRHRPDLPDLDKFRITVNDSVIMSLHTSLMMRPVLWDLTPILLEAKNGSVFLTSDSPIIVFNTFFNDFEMPLTLGWASRGVQIYVPISPTRALMLYDSIPYLIKPARVHPIPVFPRDVEMLNSLVYLNAGENLYWRDEASDATIHNLHRRLAPLRNPERTRLMLGPEETVGDRKRQIIMIGRTPFRFRPILHFVIPNKKMIGRLSPGVRDPLWVQTVKDFAKAVDDGADWRAFPDYIERYYEHLTARRT